jgi:hypothetical protein
VPIAISRGGIPIEDKLDAIRRLDSSGTWESLDDRRYCTVCKKTFSGRQIDVARSARRLNRLTLHCPTTDCDSTPEDWKPARAPLRTMARLVPLPA